MEQCSDLGSEAAIVAKIGRNGLENLGGVKPERKAQRDRALLLVIVVYKAPEHIPRQLHNLCAHLLRGCNVISVTRKDDFGWISGFAGVGGPDVGIHGSPVMVFAEENRVESGRSWMSVSRCNTGPAGVGFTDRLLRLRTSCHTMRLASSMQKRISLQTRGLSTVTRSTG